MARKPKKTGKTETANLGFEAKLWEAADQLRGSMDSSVYKNTVLGLIFLKYVSDAFDEHRKLLLDRYSDPKHPDYIKDPKQRDAALAEMLEGDEGRDEFTAESILWVPKAARWEHLQAKAKTPDIGKLVDDAMRAIEADNAALKGVLPQDYARASLDKARLGGLIDIVSTIPLGDKESRSHDIIGRVYEYFLAKFASAEGKLGGEFYTPSSVVKLLVEMIEPFKGRVFDPCCGSGGMFVQSEKFVSQHGGKRNAISVYGQESNHETWKLCKLNLAIRGIEGDIRWNTPGSFHADAHAELKADFVLANPPFNDSNWGGERLKEDARWKYGTPPAGSANFAWVQHFIHHLAPRGVAGFVLANGSMSSNQSGEGEIRQRIIEADLVDCMIALPGQLFYTTPIPVCLWFLTKSKQANGHRDRSGETLFIDARKLGRLVDRTHRELTDDELKRIAGKYHAWRGKNHKKDYADEAGFCKSVTTKEISEQGFVLTPGRYVGTEAQEDDGEPFPQKMARLMKTLDEQFSEGAKLEAAIRKNLGGLKLG